MFTSYYMRADEFWSRNGAVADTVGATDSDYTNEWLADDRPGRPVKATTGTATWTVTNTAGYVDAIVIAHHNIDAGRTVTIGGTLSATLTAPTARADGIPRNFFTSVVVNSTVATMTVGVASNSSPLVIGGLYAGKLRAFPRAGLLVDGMNDEPFIVTGPNRTQFRTGPSFDNGMAARTFQATVRCNTSQLEEMLGIFDAQKNESLPSVFILDIAIQDARIVNLAPPKIARNGLLWRVGLEFQEYPRVRW